MRTSISLLFRIRKPKNYKSGQFPINLRITVDGQRCEIAMSRKCDPSKRSPQVGKAKGTREDIKQLNAFLDDTQIKILNLHRQMTESYEEFKIQTLKNRFTGKTSKTRTLLDVFTNHSEKMRVLVGILFVIN
jgi:site-specific recombinase